ncbi:S8 family serine peptidase [Jatrophihabitans fulvus]
MQWRKLTAGIAVTITAGAMAAAFGPVGTAQGRQVSATPARVDPALGNGLGRLVPSSAARAKLAVGGVRIDQGALAIRDAQGRVLIDMTPQAGVDRAAFRARAAAAGLAVTATDAATGTLEGYVATSAIRSVAAVAGTGTIKMVPRPTSHTGSIESQGVAFQRIDKVLAKGVDGKGVTVGILSDSYDTATETYTGEPLTIHAQQDIASGDLPGYGNPKYPTPVVVIQDLPAAGGGHDEGRAMAQIIHDIAPAAKLCFATAFAGEIQFADNIRRLADPAGKCKADVVVDDVGYGDEPVYSDGPVAQAVDDVAKQGVSYFSSAGNADRPGSWESPLKLVPAKKAAKGTNLDLSEVPPALISGGLQDMNPGSGVDVAQSVTLGDSGSITLHWDDPLDRDGTKYGASIFHAEGELTASTRSVDYQFTPSAADLGKQVSVKVDGVPSGSTDVIVTVTRPDGSTVGPIDTGSSPEFAGLTLTQSGTYTITVDGFDSSVGGFTVDVLPVTSLSKVTTDFNVLLFTESGEFVGSSGDDNRLTGLPVDILSLGGPAKLQIAIAKTGTAPTPVTHLNYIAQDDFYQTEYYRSLANAIYGHPAAAGANAVAAYDPYKSFLPESFTSPGGKLPFYFDRNGNRLSKPQYRAKPDIASTDGGNTTFFISDTPQDPDPAPNFFGTSAAAPHAAGIAALMLQRAGGSKSLTPKQVTARMKQTAFRHDLDPDRASGTAGGLTLSAKGPQGSEGDTVPRSMNDPRFFTLSYTGKVPLRSVTLYGETASPTAFGKLDPPSSDGVVFDPRPFTGSAPFYDQGFPFTVGGASGVKASSVTPTYGVPYGTTGTYRHLRLNFTQGLKKGATLRFGVDRDLAVWAPGLPPRQGNGADELGGAVFLPQGSLVRGGLTFQAVRADGSVIRGTLVNRLGTGWTPLDGWGMVNAQRAVFGS